MRRSAVDGPKLYRRTSHKLQWRIPLANAVGGTGVAAYLILTVSSAGGPDFDFVRDILPLLVGGLIAFPLGSVMGRRSFERACGWLREQRPATDREQRRTLAQPWRQATKPFFLWLGFSVFYAVANPVLYDQGAVETLRIVDAILLGGLMTCALTFLLIERAFRPVFALALAGEAPDRPRLMGIRSRLLLSWAIGSGIPLLGLVITPFTFEAGARFDLSTTVAILAGVGLFAGFVAMAAAANSVAAPVNGLRSAFGRVQAGELATTLVVDDGGELGLAQAGFNRMAEGLRERERLHDLFGRHVGVEVARQALNETTGLGGEQREASVLFVDLIGSTAMAEVLPPGEVVDTLNTFFGAVVEVVTEQGGWVNKFEGDGALCVFGAPSTQPDHAARALRAARTLHRRLSALAEQHPGIDAGIGVSSGPLVAGNVGTERRYEYTVIGRPVNEAARLTDLAKGEPGRVVAGEGAIERAGDEAAAWRSLGTTALRGQQAPTRIHAPVEAGLPVNVSVGQRR